MIGGRVITIDLKQQIDFLKTRSVRVQDVGSVMMVAGKAVHGRLVNHFREKNQKPNSRGFKRQNFWAQIRDAVQKPVRDGDAAIVQVNDPRLNPHVFGAVITPKAKKALAIPVHPQAYGVRAATFDDLVMIRSGKGKGNVVGVLGKRVNGGDIIEAWYVLVKRATVPKDPTALPPDAEIESAAGKAVQLWIGRNIR